MNPDEKVMIDARDLAVALGFTSYWLEITPRDAVIAEILETVRENVEFRNENEGLIRGLADFIRWVK